MMRLKHMLELYRNTFNNLKRAVWWRSHFVKSCIYTSLWDRISSQSSFIHSSVESSECMCVLRMASYFLKMFEQISFLDFDVGIFTNGPIDTICYRSSFLFWRRRREIIQFFFEKHTRKIIRSLQNMVCVL